MTTTLTRDLPNPVDRPMVPYTCPVCSVEFPSWATWTRKDKDHYTATRHFRNVEHDGNEGVTDRDNVDVPEGWTGGAKNSRQSTPELATPAQLAYIARLGGTPDATMSKRAASKLIDSLLDGAASAAMTPAAAAPVRSNKFAGPCAACHADVPAETGSLTSEGGRWVVRHIGTCPTPAPVTASPATVSAPSVDVPDGYYAIESTGTNDLAFYRVKHSDRWGVSVSLVVGGHADQFVPRKSIAGILARIAADDGAAKRYADEIGSCYRCNRTLTDEESRRLGIGPTCRNLG